MLCKYQKEFARKQHGDRSEDFGSNNLHVLLDVNSIQLILELTVKLDVDDSIVLTHLQGKTFVVVSYKLQERSIRQHPTFALQFFPTRQKNISVEDCHWI